MCTNGKEIRYNKDFINKLGDSELRFVFLHEVLHIAYMHCCDLRLRDRNKIRWNIAGDFVINFDITQNVHTYLHRIGRSGRWGRKGVAINFATFRDRFLLEDLEKYYHIQIAPMPENLMLQ
jgi:hypothetical protein